MRKTMAVNTQELGCRLYHLVLGALPLVTILLLVFILMIPFNTPVYIRCGGLLPLMGITYWTLVTPRSMSPVIVFIIGILVDVVTFMPLGMHAIVFLIVQSILKSQRRFLVGQGFWVLWVSFVLLSFVTSLMLAIGAWALKHVNPSIEPIMIGTLIVSVCLPLLLWWLDRVHVLMDLLNEPV